MKMRSAGGIDSTMRAQAVPTGMEPGRMAVAVVLGTNVFVDIGANVGDSLVKWYSQTNCYENCRSREACVPSDPTTGKIWDARNCTFCATAAKYLHCGWEFPYWMALSHRRTYCAEAFEPNEQLAERLRQQAALLQQRQWAPRIDVRTGVAVSVRDGTALFGLDENFTTGSSLVLDKRTMDGELRPGKGRSVGMGRRVSVRTVDAIRYLRSIRASRIAVKLDVEGSEFELLRDLIASGVLCERVDHLWVEWHGGGRINYRTLGLPVREEYVERVFSWVFETFQGRRIYTPQQLSPHCKTMMIKWA